jgi:hypothetical protein
LDVAVVLPALKQKPAVHATQLAWAVAPCAVPAAQFVQPIAAARE